MGSDAFKTAVEREDAGAIRDSLAELVRPQSGLAALTEAMGRQFARLGITPPRA